MIYPIGTLVVLKGPASPTKVSPDKIGRMFTVSGHRDVGYHCNKCGNNIFHHLAPELISIRGNRLTVCQCVLMKIDPDANQFTDEVVLNIDVEQEKPKVVKHCVKA